MGKDAVEMGSRGLVKYGIIDPTIEIVKEIEGEAEAKNEMLVVEDKKEPIKNKFAAGGVTKDKKYWKYTNQFDGRKGFNYIPIANVGNSNYETVYDGVKGIAHFLLDSDISQENAYMHQNSIKMRDNQLNGKPSQELGSTVSGDEFFFPVYTKNDDGTVNVKYLKKNEIDDKSKIMSPLRQYKFSDLDWDGETTAQGFNNTVSSVPTKLFHPADKEELEKNPKAPPTKESHFIFGKDVGKKSYGKYGGTAVVFIVDRPNGNRKVLEMAGSVLDIKEMGKNIIKNEDIKPEDLIIAYHDVGSYSAKPIAKDGKLSFQQWSGFNLSNVRDITGGGLAFPQSN